MDIYAAGAVAAFTVDVLVYPLDTIKTRYQSRDYLKAFASESKSAVFAPKGLYHGIGSVVLATLPAAGLFFSTYESAKTVLAQSLPLPEPLIHSGASSIAEMASCLVLAPAEVIKQNAQMIRDNKSNRAESTSLRAFRGLSSHGASRRLFTGYTALVARNLPFTALQFPLFEQMRRWMWRRGGNPDNKSRSLVATGLIAGVSAASAGSFAAFITTPSDVVKTRMMLSAASNESGKLKRGSWAVAQDVFRERGIIGFFRGGLLRSAWTAIGSGLYLGTYDTAKLWLTRRKPELDGRTGL